MINICNYVDLSSLDAAPITIGGISFPPPGLGSGMRGVPGDSTPPSRFIRILFQKQFASAALQASDGDDYKQWVVVKALTAGTFSYRTVDNPTLMQINFDELDLDNAFEATSQMPNEANYIDVTGQLSLIPVES